MNVYSYSENSGQKKGKMKVTRLRLIKEWKTNSISQKDLTGAQGPAEDGRCLSHLFRELQL